MDVDRSTNGWDALGALVREARTQLGLSQATVVDLLNRDLEERGHPRVHQSVVSDNEKGARWRDRPELVGAYTRVLRLSDTEVIATLYGVRTPHRSLPSFEELVETDPSLDDASKEHIVKQYALLRAATLHHRMQRRPSTGSDRSAVTDEEVALIERAFSTNDGDQPDGAGDSGEASA